MSDSFLTSLNCCYSVPYPQQNQQAHRRNVHKNFGQNIDNDDYHYDNNNNSQLSVSKEIYKRNRYQGEGNPREEIGQRTNYKNGTQNGLDKSKFGLNSWNSMNSFHSPKASLKSLATIKSLKLIKEKNRQIGLLNSSIGLDKSPMTASQMVEPTRFPEDKQGYRKVQERQLRQNVVSLPEQTIKLTQPKLQISYAEQNPVTLNYSSIPNQAYQNKSRNNCQYLTVPNANIQKPLSAGTIGSSSMKNFMNYNNSDYYQNKNNLYGKPSILNNNALQSHYAQFTNSNNYNISASPSQSQLQNYAVNRRIQSVGLSQQTTFTATQNLNQPQSQPQPPQCKFHYQSVSQTLPQQQIEFQNQTQQQIQTQAQVQAHNQMQIPKMLIQSKKMLSQSQTRESSSGAAFGVGSGFKGEQDKQKGRPFVIKESIIVQRQINDQQPLPQQIQQIVSNQFIQTDNSIAVSSNQPQSQPVITNVPQLSYPTNPFSQLISPATPLFSSPTASTSTSPSHPHPHHPPHPVLKSIARRPFISQQSQTPSTPTFIPSPQSGQPSQFSAFTSQNQVQTQFSKPAIGSQYSNLPTNKNFLGGSKFTIISQQQVQEVSYSQLKMEESQIVVNVFHPTKSQMKNWEVDRNKRKSSLVAL